MKGITNMFDPTDIATIAKKFIDCDGCLEIRHNSEEDNLTLNGLLMMLALDIEVLLYDKYPTLVTSDTDVLDEINRSFWMYEYDLSSSSRVANAVEDIAMSFV